MSQILDIYKDLFEGKERFIDEIFEKEIYAEACPKLTIIDAGAYEGEFGFYCYNFAEKIYAFEPDPRPYGVFRDRIGAFHADKIVLSPKALSGKPGRRIFFNSGYGGSAFGGTLGEGAIEVDTITLAEFIKEQDIKKVDILKIDVEDAETDIFSAPDFPEVADKIKLIVGEHLTPSVENLKKLGFKVRNYPHGLIFER